MQNKGFREGLIIGIYATNISIWGIYIFSSLIMGYYVIALTALAVIVIASALFLSLLKNE